jgi:AraC family transcriptional regulator
MRLEPEAGYVGAILEGGLEKTFARDARQLSAGSAFTMPRAAFHSTDVGPCSTRVLVLHPVDREAAPVPWPRLLCTFREARQAPPFGAAWRLAGELHAQDEAWVLAAEGLCLELVAAFLRDDAPVSRRNGARPWLEPLRERLHERLCDRPTLDELAASAGVHPVYLARSFRERYGLSIGEYLRRVRLEWSAVQLASTETPLAVVAADAGFADQSHFTRTFKRRTGLTPGEYRRIVRG